MRKFSIKLNEILNSPTKSEYGWSPANSRPMIPAAQSNLLLRACQIISIFLISSLALLIYFTVFTSRDQISNNTSSDAITLEALKAKSRFEYNLKQGGWSMGKQNLTSLIAPSSFALNPQGQQQRLYFKLDEKVRKEEFHTLFQSLPPVRYW